MSDKPPSDPVAVADPHVFLEDVITALQKSFSRINYRTQANKNSPLAKENNAPTTRLGRTVQYEIALRVSPFSKDNNLLVEQNGSIELRLKGDLDTDIEFTATEPASSPYA